MCDIYLVAESIVKTEPQELLEYPCTSHGPDIQVEEIKEELLWEEIDASELTLAICKQEEEEVDNYVLEDNEIVVGVKSGESYSHWDKSSNQFAENDPKEESSTGFQTEQSANKKRQCSSGIVFDTASLLEGPKKARTSKKPFSCDICSAAFTQASNLQRHILTHSEGKPYGCDICLRSYTHKHSLYMHRKVHFVGRVQCKICCKTFSCKEYLVKHSRLHSGEGLHSCVFCSKSFICKSAMVKHTKKVHKGQLSSKWKPFADDIHAEVFPGKVIPPELMLVETEEQHFTCDYCGRSFARKDTLIAHIRRHMGEKPYKCDFCPWSFVRKEPLMRHMRRHTGEKPYQCGSCGKKFAQIFALKSHEQLHNRPYNCNVCSKSFKNHSRLEVHERSHAEEKYSN